MKIAADENIPFVRECFSCAGDVETFAGGDLTAQAVKGADILLVRSVTQVDAKLLSGSRVRFVGTTTIGFDHVDRAFLSERGIGFASAPGSNANSVAEYLTAAMLELAKKYRLEPEAMSIGIIGVGNVGSRLAEKAAALGMEVYLNDPPLARESGEAKYRPIEELFGCDIITLHTPLTLEGQDKTFHLADENFFASMKEGSIFFNTSRGAVVDTSALKKAIERGKLQAAVLDVWENEPDIDIELLEMVDIATPHIAGYSFDGKVAGMIMIYRAACEYLGIKAKFDAGDFLPAPAVAQVRINAKGADDKDLLLSAVRKVYDIMADDARMRGILKEAKEERGKFFSGLRKNYPVRREFGNTQIVLESKSERAAVKLAGIGFKV